MNCSSRLHALAVASVVSPSIPELPRVLGKQGLFGPVCVPRGSHLRVQTRPGLQQAPLALVLPKRLHALLLLGAFCQDGTFRAAGCTGFLSTDL